MKMTKAEVQEAYNEWLDELEPLDNINCNSFSVLLQEGDPIAYRCGFYDFCAAEGIEIEDD